VKKKIAFDIGLMRPGCPIVQATLGGDPWMSMFFPVEKWLLAPTPAMRVYEVDGLAQLHQLVERVNSYAPG
jgi:hypothetical protein